MGEVEEQRHVCKICNKSCVSGKSLGGHMRLHLALISASRKAAKAEAALKINCDQSNSRLLSAEEIKNCESNTDFGDGDQNNSYELRENPKKSWRISDPKHGLSKNWHSCKECDKEFPSVRALSGHMRCHSTKNKQVHHCRKCGKGFDSIKAMYGHMKIHPKKSNVPNETTDSLSDLENFCPIRQKRSRIRYKSSPDPSFSNLNESKSAVDQLEEAEEAATCLIMLSRGVRDCLRIEKESSDDYNSVYFRSKKFSKYDGHFMSDVENKKLDHCLSGYAYPFNKKNVNEFDDLDSKFVAEEQTKVDSEVYEDEMKVDFALNNGWIDVHKALKYDQSYEFDYSRNSGCTKSAEFDQGSSEFFESNSCKKVISSDYEFDYEMTSSGSGANCEILENYNKIFHSESTSQGADSGKRKEYECPICYKVISQCQALGDHKRAHYNEFNKSKTNREAISMNQEVARVQDMFDHNILGGLIEAASMTH